MKKISAKYLAILLAILLLAGFLRIYKLGNQSLIADEYLGINISYGYNQTGEWKFWDFNREQLMDWEYTRAQVYYWQVAQLFNFIEPTEANSRLVSVGWGLISVLSIFLVSYLVTGNVIISLISSFLMAVSVSSLTYDRKLRMYSMFVPLYLLFSYAIYYFLESVPKKGFRFVKAFHKRTKLNWNFFIPLMLLGFLSYKTHLLTVNIIPMLLVYLVIMGCLEYRKSKNYLNRYFIYLLIFVVFIISGYASTAANRGMSHFSWWINNWSYLEKITLDYNHMLLSGLFFVLGVIFLLKNLGKKGAWTVMSYLVPLGMAIMTWERSAGHQYILFTQSFKIIIMATGFFFFSKTIADKIFGGSKRWLYATLVFSILLLLNFAFFFSEGGFYESPKKWTNTNYREGYDYYKKHRMANSAVVIRPAVTYYLDSLHTDIISYNEDDKLRLDEITSAQKKYDEIWFIFSKSTYVDGATRRYIQNNFELIETKYTNNKLQIRRWRKKDKVVEAY